MGFELQSMIDELREILTKDQKAAKTVRQAINALNYWEQYAYDCGKLGGKSE